MSSFLQQQWGVEVWSKFGRSFSFDYFKEYIYFLKIYIFQSNYFLGLLVKSVENS